MVAVHFVGVGDQANRVAARTRETGAFHAREAEQSLSSRACWRVDSHDTHRTPSEDRLVGPAAGCVRLPEPAFGGIHSG
jgi:hypothetical protein